MGCPCSTSLLFSPIICCIAQKVNVFWQNFCVNTCEENIMLKTIFSWFNDRKPAPEALAPDVKPENVPYKIETPVASVLVGVPEPVPVEVEVKPTKRPRVKKDTVSVDPVSKPTKSRKKK
jgi:hypothetical protein